MKVRNLNASSAKTKRLIRKTFLELLHEKKQLRKISVSELVRRAELDRSTFYAHYSDIFEIAEEMEVEIIREVFDSHHISGKEDVYDFFRGMYDCFAVHHEEYAMLLASDEPIAFLRKLKQMALDKVLENPVAIGSGTWQVLKLSLYVNGMMEEHIAYFRGQSRYAYEELKAGLLSVLAELLQLPDMGETA